MQYVCWKSWPSLYMGQLMHRLEKLQILFEFSSFTRMAMHIRFLCRHTYCFGLNYKIEPLERSICNCRRHLGRIFLLDIILVHDAIWVSFHKYRDSLSSCCHNAALLLHLSLLVDKVWVYYKRGGQKKQFAKLFKESSSILWTMVVKMWQGRKLDWKTV